MKKALIIFPLTFILALYSCKKAKDGTENTQMPEIKNENRLSPKAVIVNGTSVVKVEESTITLKKNGSPSLVPGNILVGQASEDNPDGFLRKVISVKESNNQISINTEQANLKDAFDELHINTTFKDSSVSSSTTKTLSLAENLIKIEAGGFKINGVFKLNVPEVVVQAEKTKGALSMEKILLLTRYNTEGSNLEMEYDGRQRADNNKEVTIKSFQLPKFRVLIPIPTPAGVIPWFVPIYQSVDIKWKPFEVSGKVKWKAFPVISGTLGASYQNNSWENLTNFSVNAGADSLKKDDYPTSVDLNAQFLIFKPEYALKPYNSERLQAFFQVPFDVNLAIKYKDKPNYKLGLTLGVKGGIKVEFWSGAESEFSAGADLVTFSLLEGNWKKQILKFSSTSELSSPKYGIRGAGAGDVILFAGDGTRAVEIYNTKTESWTTSQLSQAREKLVAVSAGNKVFFAGGINNYVNYSRTVDIYDVLTGKWSTAQLSVGRAYLAAAAYGNKVVFAGGDMVSGSASATVDIYDIANNKWSTAQLSEARTRLAGASAAGKILFAGGRNRSGLASKTVDIYDVENGFWQVAQLAVARRDFEGAGVGDKIIFAGGADTKLADLFNVPEKKWSTITTDMYPGVTTATIGDKIVFGNFESYEGKLDIYDSTTDSWEKLSLSTSREGFAIGATGKKMVVAGGEISIYPRTFSSKVADIYTLIDK